MLHPDSWFIRFLTKICDLMLLNILFIFALMTVVFSGTAVTALYTVTLRMIQGKPYTPVKDFLRAAKENFVTSVPATILFFVNGMLIFLLCNLLYAESLAFFWPVFVLLSISIILLSALLSYLFPLLAQFENTFSRHLGNAIWLSMSNLPTTFFLATVNLLPVLCILFFPGAFGYFLAFEQLIGLAAGAYVNSFYLNRVFGRQ